MRSMRIGGLVVLAAAVRVGATAQAGDQLQVAQGPSQESATVVLDTASFWRFRTVWETQELTMPSGEVKHARIETRGVHEYFQKNPGAIEVPEGLYKVQEVPAVRLPSGTSADWMQLDFDDSSWVRLRGPMLDTSIDEDWKLILMRGRFEVTDPAKVGDLSLSLAFRGGVVVYLNGEELTRAFMPRGKIDLYTPAEGYPADLYFTSEGFLFYRYERSPDARPRIEKRVRRLVDVKVPAARLRRGVNVLAVANHRAPTLANVYLRHLKGSYASHDDVIWAKIGLGEMRLVAPPGAAVVPSTGPLTGRGFKVWNQSIMQTVALRDYPDPFASVSPVRLTGVRGGTFAGQVVVGDDTPIRGLTATVSDLTGPVFRPQTNQGLSPPSDSSPVARSSEGLGPRISAAAAQVRYARADGFPSLGQVTCFDSLAESPPEEVPVYPEHGGSVQPIWITVTVPGDARPGDYAGTVTISAKGVKAVSVPIALRVIDWKLPPVDQYVARMDLIQSPESVALAYNVPLWSEEHLQLLDRTFSLLAPLSTKTLFITCIRRTHFGNEHAMVRWVRGEDGELTPDFSVVEKYLDVATRHLGRIPGVILYCWEPPESQGHAGGAGSAARTFDKPILYTLSDPTTGALSPRQGPAWGTPEAKVFWKKLTDGMQVVLERRGIEQSMLFGLVGDTRPTKQAMDDIANGVPDAKWAVHSHYYCDAWQGYPMGMAIALWGIGVQPADPQDGYSFGWSNPFWLSYYPREMNLRSTLVEHRVKLENWMGARRAYTPFIAKGIGPRGLGRIGVDFWEVLKDSRGRVRGSLAGRYPEAAWGQLNLNFCIPYLLGRGPKGPLATVRSEAFRESLQEVEARIYVEKALLDDEAPTRLGDDLIARCRTALDERIRMCLHAGGEGQPWFISSDWNARTELLFSLAAEVARKYGGRQPNPNLAPDPPKTR